MNVNDATKTTGPRRPRRKRVGRGNGSGLGKTAGRGFNGAKSRSGWSNRYGYEGGQMSFARRLPKRGFKNAPFKIRYDVVNLSQLDECFEDGDTVDRSAVREKLGLKPRHPYLKILSVGELTKRLKLSVHGISRAAREKVEAKGGSIEILPVGPKVLERKKKAAN